MSMSSKSRVWIVGVENIRPRYATLPQVMGTFVWHTDTTRSRGLKPYRTDRYGDDEMDLYVRFVRALEDNNYEIVSEEDAPAEAEA